MGKKNKNKKNANSTQESKQTQQTAHAQSQQQRQQQQQQQQPQQQQQQAQQQQQQQSAVQSQQQSRTLQHSEWPVAGGSQVGNVQQRDEGKSSLKRNGDGLQQHQMQWRTEQKAPTQPKNVWHQQEKNRSQDQGQLTRLDKQNQIQEGTWSQQSQSTVQSKQHSRPHQQQSEWPIAAGSQVEQPRSTEQKRQQKQKQAVVPSQQQVRSSAQQYQSEWPVAGGSQAGNVQQRDEGKTSLKQHQMQWRTEQRPPTQQKNVWHQEQQKQFRSEANRAQCLQDQDRHDKQHQIQEGARSQQPQKSGFPRAESTQAMQPKKSAAASGGGTKPQQKRPELPTMEELKQQGIDRLTVKYKGHGTRGRNLGKIETNYVPLSWGLTIPDYIYHYDVTFDPERPKKLLGKVFTKFVETNFPATNVFIVFDGGRNAYASEPLETTNLVHEIKIIHPETGKEMNFEVNIQEANNTQIAFRGPLTSYQDPTVDAKRALQGLDVILKAAFHQRGLERGVVGGRSFFLPSDMLTSLRNERLYLGDGFELRLGLFQSVVLGDELFLNVDVSHKAFPKRYDSFIDLLKDMRLQDRDFKRPLEKRMIDMISKQLSGLDICYTQPGSGSKTIRKFMSIEAKPSLMTFDVNNVPTTILDYFNSRRMRINYPELPCLKLGNRDHNIIVPMEFCSISDAQVTNKKCSDNQTRNIIRVAATTTDARKERIMELLNKINHNRSAAITGFGMNVGNKFVDVAARQLDPPKIQYKNSKVIEPKNGVWNMFKEEFLLTDQKPANGLTWGILNADCSTDQSTIRELCNMLHRSSISVGLCLAKDPLYMNSVVRSDERFVPDDGLGKRVRGELQMIAEEKAIRMLFCIIPDRGQIYGKIKKMAEIDHGVLTQCMKSKTVNETVQDRRKGGTTISNILLKVNAKLNGTNHKLQTCPILNGKRCMFIGADVTHPSPDQKHSTPSIVGVSASYDLNAFRYAFYWRLQGARIPSKTAFRVVEIIQDFKEVIKDHLNFYKSKNGVLPDKIFYYRDGVSEGQFDQVMAIEKSAIDQACREIEPGYEKRKELTVVVVQKRHHTRFFPIKDGFGKFNNVPVGTIVDTKIIRPNENNFLLVSHQSIQGVAKPTKYCILLDEGDHLIDDLEELSNNLCYMFTRCNRAVSYPAPTYYAHLIAARAKKYVENTINFEQLDCKNAIKANIIRDHPMFFV
ncbi:protein argonaute-2-like [Sitodiplosis mosellana]|uniref:protein argonaute-2-like n=1 Tax=Sitodiplosis mosellana TaxID=263140 RepID=UPI0024443249|nr:protein argonaute-2-like [Sitodiplosis mosellana]